MGQLEIAVKNGIALFPVQHAADHMRCELPMLLGEIPGACVYYHTILDRDTLTYEAEPKTLKTLFLLDGVVEVKNSNTIHKLNEKAVYVADPHQKLSITGIHTESGCSHYLEIRWDLKSQVLEYLDTGKTKLPFVQQYNECEQYRETFKSKKTISRAVIDHHLIPGFCMGSNEAYGPDRVEPHAHPLLDQFFFSFSDNEVNLLIDDKVQPLEGNTLIHIPLGSNHGVEIPDGKKMHYLWIDFMTDLKGLEYLDEVHIKTGVKEQFGEGNQITCREKEN